MKQIFLFFLTIAVMGCAKGPDHTTVYYANLTGVVSPYLEYTPQGEISRHQADSLGRFYAFAYERGKLSHISFYKRNQPSADSYFKAYQVRYSYDNNQISRSYFDEEGKKAIMWRHYYQGGNIHKEVYSLDESGRKSGLILQDSLGERISSGDGVFEYYWNHLAENRILQGHLDSLGRPTVFRTDIPFERLILTIDHRGYSESLTRINETGMAENHPIEGYATLKLLFDDHGNETGWSHWDDQHQRVDLPNEFSHSQWLFEKEYHSQRLGILKSFTESYYDKLGQRVQNTDSVHQVRYTFNDHGDLETLAYYNLQLNKQKHISSGFFKAKLLYDSQGNRTSVQRYDVHNQLITP